MKEVRSLNLESSQLALNVILESVDGDFIIEVSLVSVKGECVFLLLWSLGI